MLSLLLIIAFATPALVTPAWADYKKGLAAYQLGDYAAAAKQWQPLADSGDKNAQFQLGQMHEMGFGMPRNLAEAYAWYAEAADKKHPGAVGAIVRFKRAHPDAVRAAKTIRAQRRVKARQEAELKRLREERLRTEARTRNHQDRRNSSGASRQRKTKTQDNFVFSLPPGWDEGDAGAFSNAATGARIDVLDIGPKTRLYQEEGQTPETWSELILIDRFANNAAHSPETLYRQWRGRVMAGCHPGQGEDPNTNRKKSALVTTSFYTCAKLQTGPQALHAMMKAVRGKKSVYFIRRFWRGETIAVSERAALRQRFAGWGGWFDSVAMAKKKKSGIARKNYISGYGIIVSHLGHILTNAHLVRGCRKLRFSSRKAEWLAFDSASGLALFKQRPGTGGVASFREVGEVEKGAPVVLSSNPHPGDFKKSKPKTELSVSAGVVDALAAPDGDGRYLSVSLPLVDDLSGSPLLDMAGRIAGMALARAAVAGITGIEKSALESGNFVIPAASIKRFMASQGLRFRTSPSPENLSAGEAGDTARAFTVLVECWK
ncbi:MAG: trypsin-like peptidase domain-containing protein [Proteobacteria bacterium]|nr:trypsin-like peptidase domain-containing protein [Pseudomonadota bacterium]